MTERGAPRSRSNRCGNPSSDVRLPRYITTHQATTVAAVSTWAGRRSQRRLAASAATPSMPNQTIGGPSSLSSAPWEAGPWLPSTMDTAPPVEDLPPRIPPGL